MLKRTANIDPALLRKAQLKMVDILKAIDRICLEYDLQYWLAYGTLLGAVRHKGFIPWDDDCDILMPRADYEKFLMIAPKELPSNLFLQTSETEKDYKKKMAKIRMYGTKLVEFDEDFNEKYHQGIFVDVFIADYYPGFANSLIDFFNYMPTLRQKRRLYPKGSIKRVALSLGTAVPYFFHKLLENLYIFSSYFYRKNTKMPYVGVEIIHSNSPLYKTEKVFPLRRDISFEGYYFYVPNDCDHILKNAYGDYMKLPKEEDRRTHAKLIEV